jgi:hypothetical protein
MSKYFIAAYTVGMVMTAILALLLVGGSGLIYLLPFIFYNIAFICLCLVFLLLKSLKADPIFSYTTGLLITVALFIALMCYFTDESVYNFIIEAVKSRSFWAVVAPFILPNVAMIAYADYKLNGR